MNHNKLHAKFLFEILDILDTNNIEYCFIAGTLLGAIRENDFLQNDHKDTDIALDDKYYWQVRRLLDKLVIKRKMRWSGIWRKELSILSLDNKYKVDMCFMEKKENKYYIYFYKPNEVDKKWNYEWRMIHTADAIFPTKLYTFYNRKIKIPNNPELILTEQYNTWQIPDNTFKTSDISVYNADKEYKGFYPGGMTWRDLKNYIPNIKQYDIGCICTTIKRNNSVKKCIKTIQKNYPNIKMYIADQNEPTAEMLKYYEDNNVEYYFTKFDSGISYNRNFLISKVQEPYILIVDDDLIFTEETNIKIFQKILEERKDIGIVGGTLKNYKTIYNLKIYYDDKNKKIYKIISFEKINKTTNGYTYIITDTVLNFFLARKEIFNDIQWDNNLKLAEHLDFFLRMKYNTNWKVAFTPEVWALHATDEKGNPLPLIEAKPKDYYEYRKKTSHFLKLLCKKYNLIDDKSIINIQDATTIKFIELQEKENETKKIIIDTNNKYKIALVCTTIKRDEIMMKCLPSFDKYNLIIYLLDQGDITPIKEQFYQKLEQKGHHIYRIKKDFGLSAARNFLIAQITEPFVFITDDDTELLSNPYDFLDYFEKNPEVGIVGGQLFNINKNVGYKRVYELEIRNRILYYKLSDKIDFVNNFFIARKEVCQETKWDERLKLNEHTDWFLQLKQLNKWKIIYDKKLIGNHYSCSSESKEYKAIRKSNFNLYKNIIYKKWNLLEIKGKPCEKI